jgi:hypothetical protein
MDWGKLIGTVFGNAAAAPVQAVANVAETVATTVDRFVTTDEDKARWAAARDLVMASSDALQAAINLENAKSTSRFDSGWRPFAGWVCGVSLAMKWLIIPFGVFVTRMYGVNIIPPEIPFEDVAAMFAGLLGLGVFRSIDKRNGAS